MTYKAKPQSSRVGAFTTNDVLTTFSINNGAEWGLRLAVGTTAKPQSSGVGTFANNDVLATFSINNGAEWGLRLAVGTTANFTNIKFQHSVDGTVWTDVATFAQDASGVTPVNEAFVLIGRTVETANVDGSDAVFTNNLEGLLPLKPKGRIIATGAITTTYCYVVSYA